MRSLIIILCVAAQLAVLAYMVFGRESIIANGQRITIATAPIDPRDPFRGDYVRLRYPMNSFASAPTRWNPENYEPRRGDQIYAVLNARRSGLHEVSYFTNQQPDIQASEGTAFIRGRVQTNSQFSGLNSVNARFGVEQLYVQQGTGLAIEDKRGIRGGMQTAMHAQIAISNNGTAVLTDYQWSPLGIELELTDSFRQVPEAPQTTAGSNAQENSSPTDVDESVSTSEPEPPVRVRIQNLSDQSITLNNPGENCGFRLEPAARSQSAFKEAEHSCTANTDITPYTMTPGQVLSIDINLQDPRWYVVLADNESATAADLRSFTGHSELFRIVYRTAQDSPAINTDTSVWQGDLVSQGFNQQGWID